jgi:hypothetical protein
MVEEKTVRITAAIRTVTMDSISVKPAAADGRAGE